MIERIRTARFALRRRGYDRLEVDRFHEDLVGWLETGGADQARRELIGLEIQRLGERTSSLLVSADESAQGILGEAEREAARIRAEARQALDRAERKALRKVQPQLEEAERICDRATQEADRLIQRAQAMHDRLLAGARKRREDIHAEVSSLKEERTRIYLELTALSSQLQQVVALAPSRAEPANGDHPSSSQGEVDRALAALALPNGPKV
jgi:cell division septum initiation protein DivIVA